MLTLIPKVAGSEALKDLRPISLLETLRKLWSTLILRRIQRIWEQTNVLATSQHGGRPFRSTEGAITQLHNAIDSSLTLRRPLLVALWDIVHAFDSISKNILMAAWSRLGVPDRDAEWLVGLDMLGGVIPKSPIAVNLLRTRAPDTFLHASNTSEEPG